MMLKWHGHSCFEVRGAVTILTDPHDGESLGLPKPEARPDAALVSHDHYDHNAVGALHGNPAVVKGVGRHEVKGVRITGVETCHDELGGAKRGRNVAYAFALGGVRFAHMGDLGHVPSEEQAKALGKVDVLMLPVGGVFTVDAVGAMATIEKIRPRVAVPMHFRVGGLKLAIAPLSEFARKLPRGTALREVGNEVEFEADDLPEEREYWAFSL
jgi:L-ascorbate metabolism protein UlaG (beta-lactamase superfamily)